MTRPVDPALVVAAASAFIGTPYRHQASLEGVGCDCLGLVRGVWRRLHGREPERVPAYAPDWTTPGEPEQLWTALDRHMIARPDTGPEAGDVLLFRMSAHAPAKHLAIAVDPATMIHAYSGAAVARTAIGPWWSRRIVARFAFPTMD